MSRSPRTARCPAVTSAGPSTRAGRSSLAAWRKRQRGTRHERACERIGKHWASANAADERQRGGLMNGHVAIVTGANHGIGAATAQALAGRGCAVLCTFLRVEDPVDPGIPETYRDRRAQGADAVVA